MIGNPHSAVFDGLSTQVLGGNMLKTITWYDNGWGYATRVVELIQRLAELDRAPARGRRRSAMPKAAAVAINGFGRIGRTVFRILSQRDDIEVVAINDLTRQRDARLPLRFDTVHGRYPGQGDARGRTS